MKKLSSLQILMLMGLAIGSSQMYGRAKAESMNEQDAIAQAQLQAIQDQDATVEVLSDLDPATIKRIVEDENNLEATFNSIRNFINKRNKEIETFLKKLAQGEIINETTIARIAVELADAQATFEKYIAKQRAKHKHDNRYEQSIKDALMKAEQGIKKLNKQSEKTIGAAIEVGKNIAERAKKVGKQIKQSKAGQAVAKASSSAGQALVDAGNTVAQSRTGQAVAQDASDVGQAIVNAGNQAREYVEDRIVENRYANASDDTLKAWANTEGNQYRAEKKFATNKLKDSQQEVAPAQDEDFEMVESDDASSNMNTMNTDDQANSADEVVIQKKDKKKKKK